MGAQTTKYVVVLDVNGKKEQKVYTYESSTGQIVHYATTAVPTVVVPRRVVQTVIENKKVTVSNSVEQVEVFYPETKTIVEVVKDEIKDLKNVESVVVVQESGSTDATFITKGTTKKEVIVKEYSSKDSTVTKVDEQTVELGDIVRPKPISCFPVQPEVVYQVPVLETEVKKVLKTTKIEKTQIKSVTMSKNTNVQIYNVETVDESGKDINIEIVYNPITEIGTVVDVSEIKTVQEVSTTTEVKSVSGVTEIVTTNIDTIK